MEDVLQIWGVGGDNVRLARVNLLSSINLVLTLRSNQCASNFWSQSIHPSIYFSYPPSLPILWPIIAIILGYYRLSRCIDFNAFSPLNGEIADNHFLLNTTSITYFWKPEEKSNSMEMTSNIMITIRNLRMLENVLQIWGVS